MNAYFYLTFWVIVFVFPLPANGKNHQYMFFTGQYHYQYIWPHRPDLKLHAQNPAKSFEIQLGWRTSGAQQWHRTYNMPSYGIGFFATDLGNPKVLGEVRSGFLFMEFLFGGRWLNEQTFKISLGLSHFNTYHHPENNPENRFIGTPLNVHFNMNYSWLFYVNDHISLAPGFSFTHFSNGAYKKPNRGLNLFDVNMALRYRLDRDDRAGTPLEKSDERPDVRENILFLTYSLGMMQRDIGDPMYRARTLSLNQTLRRSLRARWGIGFDLFYDDHAKEQIRQTKEETTVTDYTRIGGFASCDVVINRLSVMFNLGTYFYYGYDPLHSVYKRVGLRYVTRSGVTGHIGLKAHDGRADYVEWGIGYGFAF